MNKTLKLIYTPIRLVLLGLFFFSGCLSIVFTQFLILLFFRNKNSIKELLSATKKHFVVLITFITSNFSSTSKLCISFKDKELMEKSIIPIKDGPFKLNLDSSAIVISNHQIYSDWFFIWFLAYLNNCSENFFIVMKKSLENLPILGYGMKNYKFIFLSRNWDNDKNYMIKHFEKISKLSEKCWMLIFPEGTNMSHSNLEKSNNFAKKSNKTQTDCVLLPRIKGLYTAVKELSPKTTKILDISIGYSEHTKFEMAQDIFTLWKIYILGESPKKISLQINEYDLKNEISLNKIDLTNNRYKLTDEQEANEMLILENWVDEKWLIKENDMQYFYKNGEFKSFGNKVFEMDLKLDSNWEIMNIYYGPILVMVCGFFIYRTGGYFWDLICLFFYIR